MKVGPTNKGEVEHDGTNLLVCNHSNGCTEFRVDQWVSLRLSNYGNTEFFYKGKKVAETVQNGLRIGKAEFSETGLHLRDLNGSYSITTVTPYNLVTPLVYFSPEKTVLFHNDEVALETKDDGIKIRGIRIIETTVHPETNIQGEIGYICIRTDLHEGDTIFIKKAGSGTTGWKGIA